MAMRRVWLFPAFALLIICIGAYYAFADQQVEISKETDVFGNSILVIGENDYFISGWDTTLCWRMRSGPWALYYLDHESSLWQDVEIVVDSYDVLIKKEGQIVGILDTNKATLFYPQENRTDHLPMALTLNENFFDRSYYIYPESSDWELNWVPPE